MNVDFLDWEPDKGDFLNPATPFIKNVIPSARGYLPFYGLTEETDAIDSACRGAITTRDKVGNPYTYVGSGTKLYSLGAATWSDVSKASTAYALLDDENWEFAKWGEKVIAVGGINSSTPVPPQIITLGGANFADLSGSPPQAKHIAVVRDFVVLGNLYESADTYPYRVRWSGQNDETNWVTDVLLQSDHQDLLGQGGHIQSIKGGEYGIIFQEYSTWRMDYVGSPVVFAFDEILPGIGLLAKNSAVQYGETIFFLSNEGFKALVGGQTQSDIGANKIDRWFFSNLKSSELNNVIGAIDRQKRIISWIFVSNDGGTLPDKMLIFDIPTGKWSYCDIDLEWAFSTLGTTYTLEDLDSVSGSLDALPYSLDSGAYNTTNIAIAGFSHNHKSGSFTGSQLAATFRTPEIAPNYGRTLLGRVKHRLLGVTGMTLKVKHRNDLANAQTTETYATKQRDDSYVMRLNSKYYQFEVDATTFTRAIGVEVLEPIKSSIY